MRTRMDEPRPRDRDAGGTYLHRIDLLNPELRKSALTPVRLELVEYIFDFAPAAVGTAETTALLYVRKADKVLSIHLERMTLADGGTDSNLSVGDGDDLNRFIPATRARLGAVGDIVQTSNNELPYVYPSDDSIDASYEPGATPGATTPRWLVRIILISDPRNPHRGAAHSGHH